MQLCTKYGTPKITLGWQIICLEGVNHLLGHCLHKLADRKPSLYIGYGLHPYGPGHPNCAGIWPRHQHTGDLHLYRRKRVTPPRPQYHLPTCTVCQDLLWEGPHTCGGLDPNLWSHCWRRPRGWLLSDHRLASCCPDPEGWWWKITPVHAAPHRAAGIWRPPPAPELHVQPPPPWDRPRPKKCPVVAHCDPHMEGHSGDEEGYGGEGAGTQGGRWKGYTGYPSIQPHLTPLSDPVSHSRGPPSHVEGTRRGPEASTSENASEGPQ